MSRLLLSNSLHLCMSRLLLSSSLRLCICTSCALLFLSNSLRLCSLKGSAARALAAWLATDSAHALHTLHLDQNEVGSRGARALAIAIEQRGSGLPPGWFCSIDDLSRRPYYFRKDIARNRAMGAAQWEHPHISVLRGVASRLRKAKLARRFSTQCEEQSQRNSGRRSSFSEASGDDRQKRVSWVPPGGLGDDEDDD